MNWGPDTRIPCTFEIEFYCSGIGDPGVAVRRAWRATVGQGRCMMNLLTPIDLLILVGGFIALKLFMRDSSLGGNVVVYMIFMVGFVGWKMYENA